MTSIFDNADFLDKEKELNKKIQPWVEEAKKSYHAAEGFLGNKAVSTSISKHNKEARAHQLTGYIVDYSGKSKERRRG